jgi:hypothetical protein
MSMPDEKKSQAVCCSTEIALRNSYEPYSQIRHPPHYPLSNNWRRSKTAAFALAM